MKPSVWVLLSCIILYGITYSTLSSEKKDSIFNHDQGGYYNYLPAFFIYKDLKFSYLRHQSSERTGFLTPASNKSGTPILFNRYSIGPAILLSPFFGVAHIQSYFQGTPQTGFEANYQTWMFVGCFIYLLIALFLLRQILARFFDETTIAISLLIIVLASNFSYYSIYEPLMSHNYSFFLFVLTLFLGLRWLETKKFSTLLVLGFSFGLLANTRIPNSIYALVILLWGVYNKATLIARVQLIKDQWKQLLLAFGLAFIPFIPQIIYWHTSTGYWFLNSYSFNNEQFFFLDPMIGEVLWGYKKGWLVYSPLMLLSLIGFVFLYNKVKEAFWGVLIYTILNLYVVSSWWSWWYGGSFGMRALIESMVPLSFCIAALVHWAFQSRLKQISLTLLIIFGIGLNFFQTYQFIHGCIHSFGMTRKSYWAVFGQVPPLSPNVYKEYDKYLLGVYMNEMTWEARQETKTYNERSERQ